MRLLWQVLVPHPKQRLIVCSPLQTNDWERDRMRDFWSERQDGLFVKEIRRPASSCAIIYLRGDCCCLITKAEHKVSARMFEPVQKNTLHIPAGTLLCKPLMVFNSIIILIKWATVWGNKRCSIQLIQEITLTACLVICGVKICFTDKGCEYYPLLMNLEWELNG